VFAKSRAAASAEARERSLIIGITIVTLCVYSGIILRNGWSGHREQFLYRCLTVRAPARLNLGIIRDGVCTQPAVLSKGGKSPRLVSLEAEDLSLQKKRLKKK